MQLEPIGIFHCHAKYAYDAARQPVIAHPNSGTIHLRPGCNFEQAVQDLEGVERIWLIYLFHQNPHWKPLVRPPRATRKIGVFATRAPHRPNPIGLSCVALREVSGLRIEVGAHDLLDGTPVLDIKPYVAYADSFPEAGCQWLDEVQAEPWAVSFSESAEGALAWLEAAGTLQIRAFLRQQLSENPLDASRKRVCSVAALQGQIAYRTWRAVFRVEDASRSIVVEHIQSGYTESELAAEDDRHGDKQLHRAFLARADG